MTNRRPKPFSWCAVSPNRFRAVLAAALLVVSTDAFARPLPASVAASMNEAAKVCTGKARAEPGYVTRRDVNGDGVEDFVVDYEKLSCDGESSSHFCGSAGCLTQVFASLPDGTYVEVLDDNVQAVAFRRIGGRPAMVLGLHGSSCGKTGASPCRSVTYWNGATFSPAH